MRLEVNRSINGFDNTLIKKKETKKDKARMQTGSATLRIQLRRTSCEWTYSRRNEHRGANDDEK